ncbi:unnamed protein product [Adineta steineri]|uniref:Uncharacterized protein n=1 Tax=Adineta steineri TaxID=433720 RepID=A0A814XRL7_9BILA|nr:unnamed protein product [Adineta steineri]
MINSNRTYYFTIKIQLELLEDRVVDALKNISLDVNSIIRLNGKDVSVDIHAVVTVPTHQPDKSSRERKGPSGVTSARQDEVEQEFVGSHPGDDINTSVDTQANIATAVYEASS